MTKLALSVAAMLLASSSAFAGSVHLPGRRANPAAATIDDTYIASIRKPDGSGPGPQSATEGQGPGPPSFPSVPLATTQQRRSQCSA